MLKMLTGLVAKMFRLGVEPKDVLPDVGLKGGVSRACCEQRRAKGGVGWKPEWTEDGQFTDSCMLDWLDHRSKGLVSFTWSTTNRGWRLMEVPADYARSFLEGIVVPPSRGVRKAIADFMSLAVQPSDAATLDWLDRQSGSYTGLVIWRMSESGRGWRLHETSRDGAKTTVRLAISCAIQGELALTRPVGKVDQRRVRTSRMYCITQSGEPLTFECAVMDQDGFDMWKEPSLSAAVQSVIQAARVINHAYITRDDISIQLKDDEASQFKVRLSDDAIVNAALCLKCGGLAISWSRHDYIECDCGLIAVDGGRDYNRRVGSPGDIGEVLNRGMLEDLAALPAKDRVAEWRRQSS